MDKFPVIQIYRWTDESKTRKVSAKELVKNKWKGKPFIAFSTEN
jgi:hypothetical protein